MPLVVLRVQQTLRSVCAYLVSTTILRRLVTIHITTLCSRCWVTGLLETTSRRRLSAGRGSCSPRSMALISRVCMQQSSRVRSLTAYLSIRRLTTIGGSICLRIILSAVTSTITSGRWVRPALVVLVARFTSIFVTRPRLQRYRVAIW